MKVKTNRAMSYGGRQYASGDEIDMKDAEAKVLIAAGRVSPVKQAETPKGKVETRPSQADDDGKATGKGRYKRRDVRAEDQDDTKGEN